MESKNAQVRGRAARAPVSPAPNVEAFRCNVSRCNSTWSWSAAGPSGLSAAIRLKQLDADLNIVVVEKGSEVGAHILSGAVIDPVALDRLVPDWREDGDCPLKTQVKTDKFFWMTKGSAIPLPAIAMPPLMNNHHCYIGSLGNVCRWLARKAEALGVEIYPGFAAVEVLYDDKGAVRGIATGDMGIAKDGSQTSCYTRGMELCGNYTLFAEGARGCLTKQLIAQFILGKDSDPQIFGLGIKELWEVEPAQEPERPHHSSVGWPLDDKTYGGSFLYHLDDNLVSVGFVVRLNYDNPYLSPFEEFQRFKTHPSVRPLFAGGRRISYGARAISAGGLQSVPKLTFPGGALIGDGAGFLNVPKIKGSHTAMKSGMLAAEAIVALLKAEGGEAREAGAYPAALKKCWVWEELSRARNIKPAFKWGLWPAMAYAALDTYIFRGKAPWTLHLRPTIWR